VIDKSPQEQNDHITATLAGIAARLAGIAQGNLTAMLRACAMFRGRGRAVHLMAEELKRIVSVFTIEGAGPQGLPGEEQTDGQALVSWYLHRPEGNLSSLIPTRPLKGLALS
jgi:hypothetical protein